VPVVAEDQTATPRVVASPVPVTALSTAPTVALTDSAALAIAAGTANTAVGLQGLQKGSAAIIFSAPGYKSDTIQVSVDTAQLVLSPSVVVPVGSTTTQMSVAIPYTTALSVTVNLTSSDPTVLGVPATVTIPANSSYVYFYVTGVAAGTVTVSATAVGERAASPVSVTVQ
jgi:trimeric autotransporter adhesin